MKQYRDSRSCHGVIPKRKRRLIWTPMLRRKGGKKLNRNEKAAMLAELKGLYEGYYRISPKNCDLQRTVCGEISAVQYVLHAGLKFTMEKEEVMMLFKKIDKDAEVAVTSEKLKGGEEDERQEKNNAPTAG